MTTQPQHAPQPLPDADDFLFGSGVEQLKIGPFHGTPQGVMLGGRIVRKPETYQSNDFKTKKPAFYENDRPKLGLKIDLQVQPQQGDDDGVRRLWADKYRMLDAIRDAVRAAGAKGLEVGGELYITWTGQEPVQGTSNQATLWAATYVPASTPVPGPPPTQQAQPPYGQQQYAAPPQQAYAPQPVQQAAPAPQYAPQPQQAYAPAPQPGYAPPPPPAAQQAPEAPAPGGIDPQVLAAMQAAGFTPPQA